MAMPCSPRPWQAVPSRIRSASMTTPGRNPQGAKTLSCQPPFCVLGTVQGDVDTVPYHAQRLLKSARACSYFPDPAISRLGRSTFGQVSPLSLLPLLVLTVRSYGRGLG